MKKIGGNEKLLRKWLDSGIFSKSCIGSVDESTAPVLLLAVYCAKRSERLMIEVPGLAMGEKIRTEMLQWADAAGYKPEILVLPDGISSGRKLLESEIPRARVLDRVLTDPPDILIVSAAAELSPVPDPERMRNAELLIKPGMTLPPEKLAKILTEMDYDDEPEVVQKGEFARRGGLMDVFPLGGRPRADRIFRR